MSQHELPAARSMNYFNSGKSAPDVMLENAINLITENGGEFLGDVYGRDATTGREAFMVHFKAAGQEYKIVWPILPHEPGDRLAAKRQAATMIFHDVKAKMVAAQVLGFRVAFFGQLLLPDGTLAANLTTDRLETILPAVVFHQPKIEDNRE